MKPFWSYYGGKWRIARHYPAPRYPLVIEPFAGAAGYSTWWEPKRVGLLDLNPKVASVWQYLTSSSAGDILALPMVDVGQALDTLDVLEGARNLIGFSLNPGSAHPRKTRTEGWRGADITGQHKMNSWTPAFRARVAEQVSALSGWFCEQGHYRDLPDIEATWFIDAPYQGCAGTNYPCPQIDYGDLAEWCMSRRGQVIVCESQTAVWLPFTPLGTFKANGSPGRCGRSPEAVWVNHA